MNIAVDKKDHYTIVALKEKKLNSIHAPELKSELVYLNSEGVKNIILDISEVGFADSSGLSAILIGNRLCKSLEGNFILAGMMPNVEKLIKISQLDNILELAPTVSEAIDIVLLDETEKDINSEDGGE